MDKIIDYLIIGAGPAGLQLSYYLSKKDRNYLVLEQASSPGTFFTNQPRHRKLISINKVFTGKTNPDVNLRWDWNSLLGDNEDLLFKNYSQDYFPNPDVLVQYLADYAHHYNLNIQYNTNVNSISRNSDGFLVEDKAGNHYHARVLIMATGLFKEYLPDIPGIELAETYKQHSINPEDYTNQRVLIIGKGNSGFETADNLIEKAAVIHVLSPNSVKFAWQTHFVGNLRAVNNNFLDTYQLKSQNTVIDANVLKIEKNNEKFVVDIAYSHANGQTRKLVYDHVINCTGFRFDTSIFDEDSKPELTINNRFPNQTTEWESANIPDLYFIGTVMQACDYKKTMSGFIHGFRHNIRALSLILDQKYQGEIWDHDEFPMSITNVNTAILNRINNGAGIFLQPGFLCDAVVISQNDNTVKYFKDIRKDHVHKSFIGEENHYYTISLEYGHFGGDPFSVERDPDPMKANESDYLHPIIRRFNQGVLVNEHHIQDDLESEWVTEEYTKPFMEYLEQQLYSLIEAI